MGADVQRVTSLDATQVVSVWQCYRYSLPTIYHMVITDCQGVYSGSFRDHVVLVFGIPRPLGKNQLKRNLTSSRVSLEVLYYSVWYYNGSMFSDKIGEQSVWLNTTLLPELLHLALGVPLCPSCKAFVFVHFSRHYYLSWFRNFRNSEKRQMSIMSTMKIWIIYPRHKHNILLRYTHYCFLGFSFNNVMTMEVGIMTSWPSK